MECEERLGCLSMEVCCYLWYMPSIVGLRLISNALSLPPANLVLPESWCAKRKGSTHGSDTNGFSCWFSIIRSYKNGELKKVARRTSRVKELMSDQFTNIYGYRFHYM